MEQLDTERKEVEAREEEDQVALLIPLVIAFYSSEDVLRDSSLGILRKLWKYFIYRLIEIGTNSQYAHVQAFYGNESNYVPRSGPTRVYTVRVQYIPFTTAYIIDPVVSSTLLFHTSRQVSLRKTLGWWFFGGRMPINCISDVEMILRFHCTKDSEHACKVRRYCRSIAEVEEAIRGGTLGFSCSAVQVSDQYQ